MAALPFEDGAFDAVFFHAVLYHQSQAMLRKRWRKARRVLKAGRCESARVTPMLAATFFIPSSTACASRSNSGSAGTSTTIPMRFASARRQSATLRTHGFTPVWAGASYVNHSADAASRTEAVADAKRSLLGLGPQLLGKGLATDEEIAAALAGWDAWGRDPDAVYFRCRCECVARKD